MRPRIRTLKPEMWDDEKIVALSRDARLLFLGLVTMADDEGRFRARRTTIVGHVFPDDTDAGGLIDGWIAEVKEQGTVLFYLSEGTPYGAFRHWAKHQKINRPTPSDLPPPPSPRVVKENGLAHTEKGWKQTARLSESSLNAHGDLSESSIPPRGGAFRSDPVVCDVRVQQLSQRLAHHIRRNDPKAQPQPEGARWLTDMRLLVQDRGDDDAAFAEVERIVDWCQSDSFWRGNVLSPAKLRKQFTQLVLKATAPIPITGRRENASDLLRRLRATPDDTIEGSAS